jgi:hypothetical protein
MAAIRATTAAFVIFLAAAAAAQECVSDARVIGSRGAVPELVAGPSAWNGTLLAVAKTEEGAPNAIWLALYSEALEPLVGDRLVVTDAISEDLIALNWTGEEFNLFYRSTTERIHLQRITPFGERIGGPIVINPNRRSRASDELAAVWSPALDATVVVQHIASGTSRGIYVTFVERSGAVREDQRLVAAPVNTSDLAVAVTSSGVVGIFFVGEDDLKIWLATLVPGDRVPDIHSTGIAGTVFTAAALGERFAVVRQDGEGEAAKLRWFVIDTSHTIVRADALLVDSTPGTELQPLTLISNGSELALTYRGQLGLRLRRFTIGGTLLSDAPFASSRLGATSAISAFPPAWTGTSYVIAPVRAISLTSYLVRYCPMRVQITVPPIVGVNEQVLLIGTVSGGNGPYEFEWTISRDPGGPRRQEAIQRTFPTTGPRTLTLTVTDNDGNSSTAEVTIEVTDTPPPPPPPPPRRRSVRH